MSPSGSRMQISGTSALGKFFWRRASRSKFSGSKTDGAAKYFSVKIGGLRRIPATALADFIAKLEEQERVA